eukprot:TRINITY_DN7426_c0_g1_i17.p2 TRINITY_DN7426_c0_g1~~TRINITY_DN7426_c0_g1_i17.p2  ORF type:complete len:202 (+),score=-26.76 TRINITY_DN7426_c0_g1_i17:770-1375(+)
MFVQTRHTTQRASAYKHIYCQQAPSFISCGYLTFLNIQYRKKHVQCRHFHAKNENDCYFVAVILIIVINTQESPIIQIMHTLLSQPPLIRQRNNIERKIKIGLILIRISNASSQTFNFFVCLIRVANCISKRFFTNFAICNRSTQNIFNHTITPTVKIDIYTYKFCPHSNLIQFLVKKYNALLILFLGLYKQRIVCKNTYA